jgi:hypothetical protein
MSILAEEIVEEWLNRQGYFTIRGVKLGVDEIDILAIKLVGKEVECRHIEIQASMRPVSYISKVPKELQKKGRAANSIKRSPEELRQGVKEWVEKKFGKKKKLELMNKLWPGKWSKELVINVVKSQEEIELFRSHGIDIIHLKDIVKSVANDKGVIESACGADFLDLIQMEK